MVLEHAQGNNTSIVESWVMKWIVCVPNCGRGSGHTNAVVVCNTGRCPSPLNPNQHRNHFLVSLSFACLLSGQRKSALSAFKRGQRLLVCS